jgi:hypothetical protein
VRALDVLLVVLRAGLLALDPCEAGRVRRVRTGCQSSVFIVVSFVFIAISSDRFVLVGVLRSSSAFPVPSLKGLSWLAFFQVARTHARTESGISIWEQGERPTARGNSRDVARRRCWSFEAPPASPLRGFGLRVSHF